MKYLALLSIFFLSSCVKKPIYVCTCTRDTNGEVVNERESDGGIDYAQAYEVCINDQESFDRMQWDVTCSLSEK